jgi:hypothetical protein
MRWISILVCMAALAGGANALQAQSAPAKTPQGAAHLVLPPVPKALLQQAFAGWVAAQPPKKLTDAAQADPAHAAALTEYGFTDAALADYKRSSETLSLRALRFHDASGAFGAYSFYRQNGWPKEEIGSGATSDRNRVLFWVGNTLVDANFSRISPMSGSELRELASQLPMPEGGKALAPPILANLPQTSLEKQTTHYALGPASYAGAGGVLPPELVGFDRGAEAVTANYSLRSNSATLTIIDYPTPQMAAEQETRIRAYIKAGSKAQPPWPKPLQDSDQASLEVRRSGPLVVLVSGDAIPEESHTLLETVHFESELMSIPQPTESEASKTAKFLVGITLLIVIGTSAAILLGFFLGGFRAVYRISRGKPASSIYDEEFISLNLRDSDDENSPSNRGAESSELTGTKKLLKTGKKP